MTFGSRGDTQPHVALGLGFQRAGYDVLALCNEDGVRLFDAFGLAAKGVHFDMSAFLNNDPKMLEAMANNRYITFAEAINKALLKHLPADFPKQWEAACAFQPDIILSCTLTLLQAHAIGQALRVPVVQVFPLATLFWTGYPQLKNR